MGGGYPDSDMLIRRVKSTGLLNKHLQSICGFERLTKIGVKADLQTRIIDSRPSPPSASCLLDLARFVHNNSPLRETPTDVDLRN